MELLSFCNWEHNSLKTPTSLTVTSFGWNCFLLLNLWGSEISTVTFSSSHEVNSSSTHLFRKYSYWSCLVTSFGLPETIQFKFQFLYSINTHKLYRSDHLTSRLMKLKCIRRPISKFFMMISAKHWPAINQYLRWRRKKNHSVDPVNKHFYLIMGIADLSDATSTVPWSSILLISYPPAVARTGAPEAAEWGFGRDNGGYAM